MNKFIIAALAASTIATPVMAAPYQNYDHRGQVEQRFDHRNDQRGDFRQMQARRWNRGERFDYRQARNYRVVTNYRQYHLNAAPRGYRWVQSGNDAVLVAITSGIIGAILANQF
jgi:Ni/Co efflux regulator RcnB